MVNAAESDDCSFDKLLVAAWGTVRITSGVDCVSSADTGESCFISRPLLPVVDVPEVLLFKLISGEQKIRALAGFKNRWDCARFNTLPSW